VAVIEYWMNNMLVCICVCLHGILDMLNVNCKILQNSLSVVVHSVTVKQLTSGLVSVEFSCVVFLPV